MIKRVYYSMGLSIILLSIFLISQATTITALSFPITDPPDDVWHILNNQAVGSGDFFDEVDILNLALVGTTLGLTFQASPIDDDKHTYSGYFFWDGEENDNRSFFAYGLGWPATSSTFLYDSNSDPIVLYTATNVVTVAGNKLIIPIQNHSLIQSLNNPDILVFCGVDISATEGYFDYLPESAMTIPISSPTTPPPTSSEPPSDTTTPSTSPTTSVPGYTLGAISFALATGTIFALVIQKRRKEN